MAINVVSEFKNYFGLDKDSFKNSFKECSRIACNARHNGHMSHSFEYYMHGTLFRFSCKLPNFFQKQ